MRREEIKPRLRREVGVCSAPVAQRRFPAVAQPPGNFFALCAFCIAVLFLSSFTANRTSEI